MGEWVVLAVWKEPGTIEFHPGDPGIEPRVGLEVVALVVGGYPGPDECPEMMHRGDPSAHEMLAGAYEDALELDWRGPVVE